MHMYVRVSNTYTVHSSHFDRVRLFSQISLQDRYINTLINSVILLTGQYEVMYSKGKSLKTDEIYHMILLQLTRN